MYSSDPVEGSIRQAGGAFAEKERAQEAAYFNKLVSLHTAMSSLEKAGSVC